eukprot:TRINITY_DN996_c0_g1_i1.p1 TRINITY_DN996_c0_g1~~TRINITY_DN996_c0_g1_i1.p1  ORF type:complete len:293 (+),score=67.80 TRINITY_DN996_c0_g1_i1:49-927(+)
MLQRLGKRRNHMHPLILVVSLFTLCHAGELAVVFRKEGAPTNCSLIHLNYATGTTKTIGLLRACRDRSSLNSVPFTAFDETTSNLFFYSGSGNYIWQINSQTGEETQFEAVPAKIGYTIGLQYVPRRKTLYLLTTTTLYVSKGNTLLPAITGFKFTGFATTAVSNTTMYVTNPESSTLVSINLDTLTFTSIPISSTLQPMDLQWFTNKNLLLVLSDYQLFLLDPKIGSSTWIFNVPDGDGFPRINDIHGDTFFFSDFQFVYSVDVSKKPSQILTKQPFDAYFSQGNFHYLDK